LVSSALPLERATEYLFSVAASNKRYKLICSNQGQYYTSGPNKLECFSLSNLSSSVLWNTVAYWAYSLVSKKWIGPKSQSVSNIGLERIDVKKHSSFFPTHNLRIIQIFVRNNNWYCIHKTSFSLKLMNGPIS
jgi:hypothetical protein